MTLAQATQVLTALERAERAALYRHALAARVAGAEKKNWLKFAKAMNG